MSDCDCQIYEHCSKCNPYFKKSPPPLDFKPIGTPAPPPDRDDADLPVGDCKGDVFSKQRAAYYLDLDSVRTLEIFERDFGLRGQTIGKKKFYHRAHLDAAANKAFGVKK